MLDIGTELRMSRLLTRERQRFGTRIDPGGDMHEENTGFMQWARAYETGDLSRRSLALEQQFIAQYCASVLEVRQERPLGELVDSILGYLGANS